MNTASITGELLPRFRRQPRSAYLEIRGWSDVEPRDMQDNVRLLLCWHDYATEWLTRGGAAEGATADRDGDQAEVRPPDAGSAGESLSAPLHLAGSSRREQAQARLRAHRAE